jgi:small subunit ribosomal protein S18
MAMQRKKKRQTPQSKRRFSDRGDIGWQGPIVHYRELDVLRKFLTTSSKIMSRRRAGTSAREQRDIKRAVKYARYMALLAYSGA